MSILAKLEHTLTTPELSAFNQELGKALSADSLDDTLLQKIILERANLVESLLKVLDIDKEKRRRFAGQELKSNDIILEIVQQKQEATKSELTIVSKASKAIKKYHQV